MPSFVTWVNEWFNQPGTSQTPSQDRIPCYVAAVLMIGEIVNSHPTKRVERDIHDLLTYLLLGWNPITAWPKVSEYSATGADQSIRHNSEASEAIKRLMNFDKNESRACILPLLNCLSSICVEHGTVDTSRYIGERATMLMLALWLLDRSAVMPEKDLGAIRGCLDLYYTSLKYSSTIVDDEYAKTDSATSYCVWMNRQILRMLDLNFSTETMIHELAYIGWFASLVRSKKLIDLIGRTETWKTEVATQLENEVQKMRKILDSSKMNCDEEPIRDGSSLRRSARLFRLFKIKPPPVKIKPVVE